jgi:MFS family permease
LINLLSNAVKFTDSGSVTLSVRHAREIGHIEVIDTGVGIPKADTERIFRPFERLQPGGVEGTGLGLTITQLLVGLLGGDIKVHSEPGSGSRFQLSVYLPVVNRPSDERAEERQITGYIGPRRRVLVVDDEAAHRALLLALLAPIGFDVVQAASAVGRVLIGWITDRVGDTARVLAWNAGLLTVITVGGLALTAELPLLAVYAFFAVLGATSGCWPGAILAEVGRLAPQGQVSLAISGSLVITNVGKFLGPIVFANAYALTHSYAIAFASLLAPAAVAFYCLVAARRGNKIPS